MFIKLTYYVINIRHAQNIKENENMIINIYNRKSIFIPKHYMNFTFYGPNVTFSANSIGRRCLFLLHGGGRLTVTVTSSTLGLFHWLPLLHCTLMGEADLFMTYDYDSFYLVDRNCIWNFCLHGIWYFEIWKYENMMYAKFHFVYYRKMQENRVNFLFEMIFILKVKEVFLYLKIL